MAVAGCMAALQPARQRVIAMLGSMGLTLLRLWLWRDTFVNLHDNFESLKVWVINLYTGEADVPD